MTRIFTNGNLLFFQNNDTLSYEAYPRESIVIKYNNGRYYFVLNGATVFSKQYNQILDQNGASFNSQADFEQSLSTDDIVPGLAIHRLPSAASTNATLIKTGKSIFKGGLYVNSTAATTLYVKYYNKATVPTVGTDIPILTIALTPAQSKLIEFESGVEFDYGLAMAITGAVADNDTTAVAANDVIAQTFVEGLASNSLLAQIETNSVVAGLMIADGALASAINTSSTIAAILIDQP